MAAKAVAAAFAVLLAAFVALVVEACRHQSMRLPRLNSELEMLHYFAQTAQRLPQIARQAAAVVE